MVDSANVLYSFPIVVTLVLFAVFVVEHFAHVKNIAFQAVFIRCVLIFPVASILAYFGGNNLGAHAWIEVPIAVIEGYVFMLFYGLFVGWAWCVGDVYENIKTSPRTSVICYLPLNMGCGKYSSAEKALSSLKWQMYQFIITKTVCNVLRAAFSTVDDGDAPMPAKLGIALLNLIGIVVALRAVMNLYFALKHGPVNLLAGLNAAFKFVVIKTFLFFIVLNSLIVAPLTEAGKLVPPPMLCSSLSQTDPHFQHECIAKFEAWVFMLESMTLAMCAVFFFRPHDLDNLDPRFLTGSTSRRRLSLRVFMFWDVLTFMVSPEYGQTDVV